MVRIRKNNLHYHSTNIIVDNASEEFCKQSPPLEEIPKEKLPVPKPELKISNTIVDMVEVRRSSRERKPTFFDSEEIDIELPRLLKRPKSSSWQRYSARPLNEVKFASDEERAYAIQCAGNFQRNLLSGNPCFIKSMVRTQVYSCFWLGIPTEFCLNYLPSNDVTLVLEDEDGVEYYSFYLADRKGLSGGWRAFALAHKLDDGDALVFELTEPRRLEIYIFKAVELHTRKVVIKKANINSSKLTCKKGDKKATKNSNKKAAKLNQDENSVVENDCPFTSPKAHTGGDDLKTTASCSNEGIFVMKEALHSYEDSEGSVSSMVPHEGLCKRERHQTLFRITPAGGWKLADFCISKQTFELREDGKSREGGDSSASPSVQLSDDLFRRKRTFQREDAKSREGGDSSVSPSFQLNDDLFRRKRTFQWEDGKSHEGGDSSVSPLFQSSDDDLFRRKRTFQREAGKSCEGGDSSVSPLVQLSDDDLFRRKRT